MTLEHVVFVTTLAIALISGYTTRITARGGLLFGQNIFRAACGAIGTVALFALIIWGFIYIEWYVVVASFLLISFFVVPLAFGYRAVHMRWTFWYGVQPVLDTMSAGATAWLYFTV